MKKPFRVRIVGVERVNDSGANLLEVTGGKPIGRTNATLYLTAELYHGGTLLSSSVATSYRGVDVNPRWHEWLYFNIMMLDIPRATRICFTLWASNRPKKDTENPLGWVACTLFDYKHTLKTGLLRYHTFLALNATP